MNKKLPLRKCLQCNQLKREQFHGQKCQACYEQNKLEAQIMVYDERGIPFPGLDRNLIYQPYMTTFPEPHDYVWHFLKWLYNKWEGRNHTYDPELHEPKPAYESMLLTAGYDAETRCEEKS